MFNNKISPVSPITNAYLNNLIKVTGEPDYSLTCLGIALIKPRVKTYSGIKGFYRVVNANEIPEKIEEYNTYRSGLPEDIFLHIPGFYYLIANISSNEDIVAKAKELELIELTMVENFVKQQTNVSNYNVFINSENNTAFVVVNSTSMSLYHLSISFISLLYPAIFKEQPLSKEEMEAVKSLTNKTSANFTQRISALLQYMKKDLMRAELEQCFKGFRQAKINQCKAELEATDRNAERALDEYRRLIDHYNDLVVRFEGLSVVNCDDRNSEEQEIIEYISSCPNLYNVNYSGGSLSFCVSTVLTNFDIEKWKNAVRRNSIYDNYRLPEDSVLNDKGNRKLLLDSIFNAKPLLYVKMKGEIELSMPCSDMSAPRGQIGSENNSQLKHYITNPHFKLHGCPGRNREQINRCLKQSDVISAIECCIAATGSVNIDETEYTFRPFLQEILSSQNKILTDGNGKDMTPEEALLWISKKKNSEEHAS